MEDMNMAEDKRYKYEKNILRSLLEDTTFAKFKEHFYNLILKFEGLGSPNTKKGDGGGKLEDPNAMVTRVQASTQRTTGGGSPKTAAPNNLEDFLKQNGF